MLAHASLGSAATHPPLTTTKGIVASDHPLASKAGAEVLENGGSAVDAAAATAFALGVVNPSSSGIGGGGFAVIYVAKEKRFFTIDFRETGPAAIRPSSYVRDGKLDPSLSRSGGLAVAVPGEVAGLEAMWKQQGKLPWADVVEPARRLASQGFQVGWFLDYVSQIMTKSLGPDHALSKWLSPNGRVLYKNRLVRRSALARTLKTIASQGSKGFYEGPIAADIVATVSASGGVLTAEDLRDYRALQRAPLVGSFKGLRVVTMDLPSSGGILLLEMLGILDASKLDLAAMGSGSSAALHVVAEILKHAFADRARLLGDDAGSAELAKQILDPKRLSKIAKRISLSTIGDHGNYGSKELGAPHGTATDGGTSHLCVVDAEGNAVALTTTVNGYFGSKLVTSRSGMVLNNEMDDFSLASGVANMFGLVQSDYNLVGPGKRPLSSMTPTLLLDDEGVVGCFGGSGGPRIISNTFQGILNVFVHGLDAQAAVSQPRVHHQWLPDVLGIESDVPSDVIEALKRRGHAVKVAMYRTAIQIIIRRDGKLQAASDPRKAGAPAAAE